MAQVAHTKGARMYIFGAGEINLFGFVFFPLFLYLSIYIYSLYMAVCILYVRADNCDNQVLLQELITLIT